ncbi:MAG: hypothetical protein AABX10_00775 [Nanoarchaeota archaeon]
MIFYLLILILAVPTGIVIAKLAHDELIDGFIYIKLLCEISFLLVMIFSFYDEVITVSLGFICIVSYVSLLKRYDKRWAVERNR